MTTVPYLTLDPVGDVSKLVITVGDLLAFLQEHGHIGLGQHQELPPNSLLGLGEGVEG